MDAGCSSRTKYSNIVRPHIVGSAYLVCVGGDVLLGEVVRTENGKVRVPTSMLTTFDSPVVIVFREKQQTCSVSVAGVMSVMGREVGVVIGTITTTEYSGTIQFYGDLGMSCDLVFDPLENGTSNGPSDAVVH